MGSMWREPYGPTLFTCKPISKCLESDGPAVARPVAPVRPYDTRIRNERPWSDSPLVYHACLPNQEFRARTDTTDTEVVAISVT